MELKTNYQYTYFVYPFVIKESKYQKYIYRLLRNKRIKIKTFEKEKDITLYKYFTPKVREFLFSSFSMPHSKVKKLQELPIETQSATIAQIPCTIFEYNIEEDIQGKAKSEASILFKISKVELICFNTGICFVTLKTNVDDSNSFSDIVNFNYKFREINQKEELSTSDNIKIEIKNAESTYDIVEFVKSIAGSPIETMKIGLNTERFLVYSYVCIDGEMWNQESDFETIKNSYIKYSNVLPMDNNSNIKDKSITISNWKYAKLGITKNSTTLFTSNVEMNNFTILPEEFENQYLYTYIINLYKRLYLKKLNYEFKTAQKPKDIRVTRKKFVEFTQNLWIQEITEDEVGNTLNQKYKEKFEMESIYHRMKHKYDILYKEMNVEKNARRIKIITIILIASLIFNILNFIMLLK